MASYWRSRMAREVRGTTGEGAVARTLDDGLLVLRLGHGSAGDVVSLAGELSIANEVPAVRPEERGEA